ncbi:MAG: 50S ribosomal protein L7/L12 [Candidatus Coatesbacteria bacterium]
MSKLNPTEVLEDMKGWTLLQFNEFIKAFEAEFQVSAAAAMVAAPAAGGGAAAAGAKEAPSTVNVVLAAAGDKKIAVIKVVREVTGLGLKEAKELVDGAPKPVKEGVTPEEGEAIKAKFAESGATIEIK